LLRGPARPRLFPYTTLFRSLAALHRVDYTTNDKSSFAMLNRALTTLPAAPPLPDPLPPPPAVPASYLFDLRSEIESTEPLGSERSEEHTSELQSREKLVCRL